MILPRFLDRLFSLPTRRRWQARQLRGRPTAAPLLAYLDSPLPDRQLPWSAANYLALDLETTGGDPERDDILSFGWVALDGPEIRLSSATHQLVRPRRALNEASVVLHRITDDRAAEGRPLRAVLQDFLAALPGRVLIAHYSPTELGFIDAACRACFGGAFLPPVVDTLDLACREPVPHPAGSLRLPALRARYHLPRYPLHHALSDALAAAELFLAQAEAASARHPKRLGELCLA